METLFIYLIKSSALTAAFFLAYYFLLRKETFFKSNRWFLLLGLVTSVVLPLVTFKKVVWIDPVLEDSNFAAVPITAITVAPAFEIDWWLVTALVYAIGIFIFFLKFVFDFGSLVKTLKGQPVKQQADFKLVEVTHNVSPFSYFNYIVYNSALYTEAELNNILEHEKVHCEQNHSADVLISRLFCILFWYNPFAWWYKKAILQNLEFIADSEALKNISDKKAYQITLLKVTTHENCVAITNHFYQSLIKKRIVMLNKEQSKQWNSWKYALIIPALAAFVFYFQVKVIAQERQQEFVQLPQRGVEVIVDKNSTDFHLNAESNRLRENHGITLKFSGVKRNGNREIVAIKTSFKDKNGNSGKSALSGSEPIAPFRFYQREEDGKTIAAIENMNTRSFAIRSVRNNAPEVPAMPELPNLPDGSEPPAAPEVPGVVRVMDADGEHIDVQTIVKDGKTKVIINGEVVADVDVERTLAELDPIFINGVDVLRTGKKGNANSVYIDTDKITREALEKARQHMDQARPQMERARREISRVRPDMQRAERELAKAQRETSRIKTKNGIREQVRERTYSDEEIAQAKLDLEQSKKDLEQARLDMEQAKKDMEQSKRDLEQSRKDLEQYKKELDARK